MGKITVRDADADTTVQYPNEHFASLPGEVGMTIDNEEHKDNRSFDSIPQATMYGAQLR